MLKKAALLVIILVFCLTSLSFAAGTIEVKGNRKDLYTPEIEKAVRVVLEKDYEIDLTNMWIKIRIDGPKVNPDTLHQVAVRIITKDNIYLGHKIGPSKVNELEYWIKYEAGKAASLFWVDLAKANKDYLLSSTSTKFWQGTLAVVVGLSIVGLLMWAIKKYVIRSPFDSE